MEQTHRQTHTHTNRRTSRLWDWIGPLGRFSENQLISSNCLWALPFQGYVPFRNASNGKNRQTETNSEGHHRQTPPAGCVKTWEYPDEVNLAVVIFLLLCFSFQDRYKIIRQMKEATIILTKIMPNHYIYFHDFLWLRFLLLLWK